MGCLAYVKRIVSDKLDAKFEKYLFIGYPKETIGYQFYKILEQRLFVSKHVVFLEKEFLLRKDSGSKVNLGEVQDPLIDKSHLTEPEAVIHEDELAADPSEAQALRRTSRICIFLERYGFFSHQ